MKFLFTIISLVPLISGQTQVDVLFIGNSYTYYNEMPSQVVEFAINGNQLPYVDSVTHGGWTLQQHAESQETIDKINERIWDVVVLQEFSSGLAHDNDTVCRDSYPYAKSLVEEVRQGSPNALIQFYLTWGRPDDYADPDCIDNGGDNPLVCDYETMQDSVTSNYLNYACMFKPAQVAPVGEAFRNAKINNGYDYWAALYVPGDHHPSAEGSYLSAALHYSQLWNLDTYNNPFVGQISQQAAQSLKELADSTMHQDPTYWEFPVDSTCTRCICECS